MAFYLNVENGRIINCSNDDITSDTVKSYEVTEEIYYNYITHEDRYKFENDAIVEDSEFAKRFKKKNQEQFEREFFRTSLGYIRRKVTMANGDIKDFLSDLLPTIALGVSSGQVVKIICYSVPDFTKEIDDWTEYQHTEVATAEFIQDCFLRLSIDFGVIKKEENVNEG